ncbi:MAG: hypothetical protein FJ134_07385 [Deltaproteobacteria bacterium]|nr:hypothetical protein [Deltaproteobacteria bacterium]
MLASRPLNIFLCLAIIVCMLGLEIDLAAAAVTPLKIRGLCYSPFRDGQAPGGLYPTKKQIEEDFKILKKYTFNILTFSSKGILGDIPKLAGKQGLKVIQGIWLGKVSADNLQEIAAGVKAAKAGSVCAMMAGSEVLLRGDLTKAELINFISQVKSQVTVPVGCAETWNIWLNNPDLAEAVDFLLVNIYPYWESISVDNAAEYVITRYQEVADAYPDKVVLIGECGWPTGGEVRGGAQPGESQQAKFVADFLPQALEMDIPFFIFEAFDENWKQQQTGLAVEAHWGIFYANRTLKPQMAALIANPPPMVELRSVNRCGCCTKGDTLSGYAYGADTKGQRIVLYSHTDAWYVQPSRSKPYTGIHSDGKFSNRPYRGEEYAALLVPKNFDPPNIWYSDDPPGYDDTGEVEALAMTRRWCRNYLKPPLPCLLGGK